ncbi:hypothetical protein BDN70DRAFT_939827 [Pholiota conissans]|uniref:Uncharacterized protein n=1 Tax=Pholiota conissans TaxID=109636 RepID=A0A9P5YKK4_9AGAR|nr:hypothetical protein BDN70DRAFT_939827 [Pholiota conissans]
MRAGSSPIRPSSPRSSAVSSLVRRLLARSPTSASPHLPTFSSPVRRLLAGLPSVGRELSPLSCSPYHPHPSPEEIRREARKDEEERIENPLFLVLPRRHPLPSLSATLRWSSSVRDLTVALGRLLSRPRHRFPAVVRRRRGVLTAVHHMSSSSPLLPPSTVVEE